jgi:putative CocE/NonD family hydrolase
MYNMKFFIANLFILLTSITSLFALQQITTDSIYHIQDSVLIATSSGIEISAIIVRKTTSEQPLPVVLFYTTYYQGEGDAIFAKRSADRDYVGVVAYARGIRTDMENYFPYENDQSDIYDIIDWLSKQEWSNGTVGMYGGSYTGYSQWSAVKNVHPALKTIVPQVAVMPGFDFPMTNNVQLGFELNWSHSSIYGKEPFPDSFFSDFYEKGYAYSKMDSVLGYSNNHFQKWMKHPSYDNYWKSLVPTPEEYEKINIPVLTTTGFFDGTQISAVEYFKQHMRHNPNAEHYLVIGPYDHWGGQSIPTANFRGYEIDSVANVSMRALTYDWLDWVLKDGPKPELLKDKVNFQVMGTNTWVHKPSLEVLGNQDLRLYLTNDKLKEQKPLKESFRLQTVDFKDRENMNNYYHPSLIIDSLDASNGVVYSSEPFEKDFIINGAFTGQLAVEINKRDMDISISFYEQTADDKYFLLSRYSGRASYAKDNSKRQLLISNKRELIPLNASYIMSKKIKIGSRFVIVANVNKHPWEIINYGSGKEPTTETILDAGEELVIKWFNDSYFEIPIWKN